MRGLVVLIGESFREGGRHSRETALTHESFENQKRATQSHIKFISHLESKFKCQIDLKFDTYQTKYTYDLVNWYTKKVVNVNHRVSAKKIVEKRNKHTTEFNRKYKKIISDTFDEGTIEYDFIFITRFDVFLKDKMLEVFNPNWDKIKFPMVWHWKKHCKTGKLECGYSYPVVVDTMLFVPKRLFYTILNFHLDLNSWKTLICKEELDVGYGDIGVMIDTMHRPNTKDMWNPLCKLISRPEKPKGLYHTKYFDKSKPPK